MPDKNKLFLVLCLHRSGSSATAGILYHLGIHMGEQLVGPHPSNPKGHYENLEFVQLNEKMLTELNGSHENPPALKEKEIPDHFKQEIINFIDKHQKKLWGLKDPRTLITFNYWRPLLETTSNITYIFTHRPFQSSIQSLANRNNKTLHEAFVMLAPYLKNQYLIRDQLEKEGKDIIDVHFNKLLVSPKYFVSEINKRIGHKPNHNFEVIEELIDVNLRHF